MSERKMKSVLEGTGDLNRLVIVRPSKLAEGGITGTVAEGIYMGTTPNKFEEDKNDFRINGDTEDFILNSAGSLASQLARVEVGSYVQVNYLGKVKAMKGKAAGKMVHNFQVLVEETGE